MDIDDMVLAQARNGVRPATRAYSLRVLRIALNVAMRKKRLIPYNPVDGANAVGVQRREPTLLTLDQARTLLTSIADDRHGPLFTLLATTGIRRGEALALLWTNWDREGATLRVERTLLYRHRYVRRRLGDDELRRRWPGTEDSYRLLSRIL